MPKEGELRVAKILTPTQVVLNGGTNVGIKIDEKFLLYGLGEQIWDPETKQLLETVEVLRGKARVIHLQEKICILESTDTKTEVRRTNSAFPLIIGSQEETVYVTRPFKEVQVGDYARRL